MRITQSFLRQQIKNLNSLVGLADVPIYRTGDDGQVIGGNPGVYCLSCAYGGYALHRMSQSGGTGINDIFGGHGPARELSDKISALMYGIGLSK
jgi:hypothetical protein